MLTDDHLKQLGRITVNFQLIETVFSFLLWQLNDPKDQRKGQILTSRMSFSRICDVLVSLAKYVLSDDERAGRIKEFVRQASQLEQKRNSVIHSAWTSGVEGDVSVRFKYVTSRRKGFQVISERTTPDDLKNIADEAKEIGDRFLREVIGKLDN